LTLGLELDGIKNVRCVLGLGNKYFSYVASFRAQKFENGVASFNLIAANSFALARRCAASAAWSSTTRSGSSRTLWTARRGRTRAHDSSLRSTTALAAIPSARPIAPSPSKVVAFTETAVPATLESSCDMAGM
jgi:hypothetical protein